MAYFELTVTNFLAVLVLLVIVVYKWIQNRKLNYPPGPISLPFVGYLPFLMKEGYKKVWNLSKKYGDLFCFYFGPQLVISVNEYEMAKEILSHPMTLARPRILSIFWSEKEVDLDMTRDNNNFVSFYIWKNEQNDTTEKDFELSMLAADGSPLIARKKTKCLFTNQQQGFSKFGRRNEIFEHRKEEFLRNDTLILRCKIWDSELTQNVHFFCSTCPNIYWANVVWTLQQFSTLTPDDEKTAPVKIPTNSDQLMDIKLFLMGPEGEDKIQINLVNPKGSIVEYCSCSVSALDISGRAIESVKKEFFVEDEEDGNEGIIELPPFLSKRILMEQKDRYLPKDTLSLVCEFSCYCGTETYISEGTYYGFEDGHLLKPQLASNCLLALAESDVNVTVV
ncbi:cytochrome P450 2J6 [Caerostris darwini]|uniref:Cytochrome P450 2J6 n=1 Tax=Caerostris darwini TaxID=1538125 RepID=A0AAV4W953_9ARAC|nr:cytochrome P450 2J6 [Caerostris darwini]